MPRPNVDIITAHPIRYSGIAGRWEVAEHPVTFGPLVNGVGRLCGFTLIGSPFRLTFAVAAGTGTWSIKLLDEYDVDHLAENDLAELPLGRNEANKRQLTDWDSSRQSLIPLVVPASAELLIEASDEMALVGAFSIWSLLQ